MNQSPKDTVTRQDAAPATWPQYADDEIAAVTRVLRTGKPNYWGGEEGRAFEQEFAAAAGCQYGVAVMNGTIALELALIAVGIQPGDEVIVTPRSFVASVTSIVARGAVPVFADIDPDSQNITAETVRAVLTPRTRAIIAVHLNGWPCDMEPIVKLAREHDLKVIEDAAQAHGARYQDRPVGSLGDVAAWSFCQDKIISTGGEGGMLTTNAPAIWEHAWSYKDHGRSYDAVYKREHPPGFRWLIERFGSNWRMPEMQAAIGRVQLGKLSRWVELRRQNAARLDECFAEIPALRVATPPPEIYHSYYKQYVFVRLECLNADWDRDRIVAAIVARGVPCQQGICPEIYREKAFAEHPQAGVRLPTSMALGETSMLNYVHPTLSDADIQKACQVVTEVMAEATA